MSRAASTQHLTEIQTLSLLPDKKIGSWSSEARKALQAGLRSTASHPKCDGIYWMKKAEGLDQIVVISKWTEAVDFATSRSYLRPILPHLASPPARSVHVNHEPHSFSSYSISNFLTVYFPIRYCFAKFKMQIAASVSEFVHATESKYGHPDSLRFASFGWIKETKMLDGEVASGFMFCLMWTDKKSEERYKSENEHWGAMMRYLKSMGMVAEDEFHGKAFQVRGEASREKAEFSDDSSDEDDDADELLQLMRDRLSRLAPTCAPDVQQLSGNTSCRRSQTSFPACPGPDVTRLWNRLDLLGRERRSECASTVVSSMDPWWEQSVRSVAVEDSDDESPDSTPLLTPSSSTMSLSSLLLDDPNPSSDLPGSWKPEYDISHLEDCTGESSSDPCRSSSSSSSNKYESPRPKTKYDFDSSSSDDDDDDDDDDGEIDMNLASARDIPARLRTVSTPSANNDTKSGERAGPRLMHRRLYGVAEWDATEELHNAKQRFWGHRRRGSCKHLRSPSPLTTTTTTTSKPNPNRVLSIDPMRYYTGLDEDRRRRSWWNYLRECLPSTTSPSGSGPRPDVEAAAAHVEMAPHDAGIAAPVPCYSP